ncbi:GNAT family N-acetyltransferase [Anaeromyxobacter paludicola]|uniref:N-acetyltransferase domain-containing protein n=1 Tax=Anaeromyxobacter paludicola TaxID=2918171 RepID=A0ABM7X9K1_9BACT|nr:GNAT family N-acetyltransferase [Anaeromyxobacter paludicola]BDG08531.1 hypothetical protein AMPC_16440 [Anaeromyxobacter paludicola]
MTGPAPLVEAPAPSDAEAIVALLREGFDPPVLELALYGCPGVERFVAEHLRMGELSPYRYRVIRGRGGLLGVAEFRLREATLFLNYVAVSPAARGAGAGNALLRSMVAEARALGLAELALDVFTFNAGPLAWYERLGLRAQGERSFFVGAPRPDEAAPPFRVPDLPQADAVHARFGFSELTLERPGRSLRVGRLGAGFFRLAGLRDATDAALHACLRRLDPGRRLVAAVEGGPPAPPGWEPRGVSRRMGVALEEVRL